MKKPSLGVIMIVKNEEANLGKILSDISGIADEICVVDTGSMDGTVAVAESFGARIGHFPWINDFGAARNHSIELASADYLLWLDADDRLDERDRKALADLKPKLRHEKDRAYMLKILSTVEDGTDSISYQTRIIPNTDAVRFEGRIHEQILPALLNKCAIRLETIDITIRHTGYHDPKAQLAKARRNLDILIEELKSGKDTANQHFFIALSFMALKEYEQCLEYIARARQKRTNEDWHHTSFIISTECLLKLERVEDGLKEAAYGISVFPNSPLLHYYYGSACMQAERFIEAVEAFGKAAALPYRIDAYPVPTDLETVVLFQLGKALEKTGRMSEAIDTYRRALKSGVHQKALNNALGIALLQAGKIDDALLHLGKARDMSENVDLALWESLAQIHLYKKSHDQAHALYLDILRNYPEHLHALAGILDTSIELDDIDAFIGALEKLLLILSIPVPEAEMGSLADFAVLCMKIAVHLQRRGEKALARRLAEAALRLDASCPDAHLFIADAFAEQGDTARMIESLETALKKRS